MYEPTEYQKSAFKITPFLRGFVLSRRHILPRRKKIAIQYSIAKWVVICEYLEQGIDLLSDGSGSTCALCGAQGGGCMGCPIEMYGEGKTCSFTPYRDYTGGETIAYRLEVARREIDFLQEVYAWWLAE